MLRYLESVIGGLMADLFEPLVIAILAVTVLAVTVLILVILVLLQITVVRLL